MKSKGEHKDVIHNYNVSSVINICNLYDLKGEFSKSIEQLQQFTFSRFKKEITQFYMLMF